MAELPEQEERTEQFKEKVFAHFEQITGLRFDRETGHCTTPGTFKMEGELKEKWARLVAQIGVERDAQKSEQLLQGRQVPTRSCPAGRVTQ